MNFAEETMQDSIGAKIGVSGGVVVIGAIFLVIWLMSAADDRKKAQAAAAKKRAEAAEQEQRASEAWVDRLRSSGPLPAKPPTGLITHLCTAGQHNQCSGRARVETGKEGSCQCSCHQAATSGFCGTEGRHDLCEGVVVMPLGSLRQCGCTCHARRASEPAIPSDSATQDSVRATYRPPEDSTPTPAPAPKSTIWKVPAALSIGDEVVVGPATYRRRIVAIEKHRNPELVTFRLHDGAIVDHSRSQTVEVVP